MIYRGSLERGPARDSDGLPKWIEWKGVQYQTPHYDVIHGFIYDSAVEAVDGTPIEPDGITCEGCPSWLLALGLI